MNRIHPPSLNGKVEVPSSGGGTSTVPVKPTTFPNRPPQTSLRTVIYYLHRRLLMGAPLMRWVLFGLLLLILVFSWQASPYVQSWWWLGLLILLAWGGVTLWLRYWRQLDYVRFVPSALPAVVAKPLDPQDKIPVHVTGYFSVEGKEQRFTWLPGFFRTFATREHALMCQVAVKSGRGIGDWPEDERGLWYIFFQPAEIQRLAWGALYFGRTPETTIAITYQRVIPKRGRFRPERVVDEVVYLTVENNEDGRRLLADLQHDAAATTPTTTSTHP